MHEILVNRTLLLDELKRVFDLHTAEVMLGVLDKVAGQVQAFGVQREDFTELKQIVQELAEAQTRTDIDIKRLIEAQTRTETGLENLKHTVQKLAEAQARTEERLDRLEVAVTKLAEAQIRTEKKLDKLSKQVGGLSDSIGGDIEDLAYSVLYAIFRKDFGWELEGLERVWKEWGKETEEVNIFGKATDPKQPEKVIWIVGEAKHNLTLKEVNKFVKQLKRAKQHLKGEIFPVCFCYRARPEVQNMVRENGIKLAFSYGKII